MPLVSGNPQARSQAAKQECSAMKWLFGVASIAGILIATAIVPAIADTCTERQQACFAYCQKSG
jgi:hypothetical protein